MIKSIIFIWVLSNIILAQVNAYSEEYSYDDRDIRCCLTDAHIKDMVYLSLEFENYDRIAELEVSTPNDTKIGFNPDTGSYYPAGMQGVYALKYRKNKSILSKKWDFNRYLLLYRHTKMNGGSQFQKPHSVLNKDRVYRLIDGNYKITVHGQTSGYYSLSLCNSGSTFVDCKSLHDYRNIKINKGEQQHYLLDGNELTLSKVK